MTTSQFSERVLEKWQELDEVLRADHSFTAAGIIAVSKTADVAVFFNPLIDKEDADELSKVIREQDVEWKTAPEWVKK